MNKQRLRITLLLHDITAMGGTARTTVALANALADHHDVDVLSVFHRGRRPFFALDRRVRVRVVIRRGVAPITWSSPKSLLRRIVGQMLASRPSRLLDAKDNTAHLHSAWSDVLLRRALRTTTADVVIGTRAALTVVALRFLPERTALVAQEHVPLANHRYGMYDAIASAFCDVDGVLTLTNADAQAYRELLDGSPVVVRQLPNQLPAIERVLSPLDATVVVAAGRLAPVKRYDLLLTAFAQVVRRHPEWRLKLFGSGPLAADLRRQVEALGLGRNVDMPGRTNRLDDELAQASLVAVSSRSEGFGMTIIEAMGHGVPVVSTDCPTGPREIITDGVDGLLVRNGDAEALAQGMLALIDDPARRSAMGAQARRTAERYSPEVVVDQAERVLQEVCGRARREGTVRARNSRR